MSQMVLKKVLVGGDVVSHQDFQNSWGYCAIIWIKLCERYLHDTPTPAGAFDKWGLLVDLVSEGTLDLQWYELNVLQSTYNKVLIRITDIPVFAKSLKVFAEQHADPDRVDHTLAVAEAIRDLTSTEVQGIGFWGTTVSDDQWWVHDEDQEIDRPYNVNIDEGHVWVDLERDE